MSPLSSQPLPEADKKMFGASFEEKIKKKKRNETVKIFRPQPPGSPTCGFFEEGSPPNCSFPPFYVEDGHI